jgi:hypothetical protein
VERDINYGTPVNLELGGAYVNLGAENRDGRHLVVLDIDGGEKGDPGRDDCRGWAYTRMSPDEALLLADVLRGLAATRLGQ